jgi:LmbE family N-acetylglucosaminyl deacetylase
MARGRASSLNAWLAGAANYEVSPKRVNAVNNRMISSGAILQQGIPGEIAAGQLLPAKCLLVLAPHADDEVLGCGGTIVRYLQEGSRVSIVYLTDGRFGGASNLAERRRVEAMAVGKRLVGCEQIFWDFADGALASQHDAVAQRVALEMTRLTPDLVFTPWLLDRHPDHSVTARAAAAAAKCQTGAPLFAAYESLTPIIANHFVDISGVIETKKELIELYASQQRQYAIKTIAMALNHYRAVLSRRPGVDAVECFHITTCADFITMTESLFPSFADSGCKSSEVGNDY